MKSTAQGRRPGIQGCRWTASRVSAEVSIDEHFAPEINVIGATVDQATDRVDKFRMKRTLQAPNRSNCSRAWKGRTAKSNRRASDRSRSCRTRSTRRLRIKAAPARPSSRLRSSQTWMGRLKQPSHEFFDVADIRRRILGATMESRTTGRTPFLV